MPRRLRPTAEIHPDAILVGDPGRAMALAQALTEQPKMANHARGLWGYSGTTADGRGLTVQSTGMGGPSAALVLSDLAEVGVERAIRVGTCAAIAPAFGPGDLVLVEEARAWSADHPGAGSPIRPDAKLAAALGRELGADATPGQVASVDFLHVPTGPSHPLPAGDVADMQTAALLRTGEKLGVAVAAVLVVTDAGASATLGDEELLKRAEFASKCALCALL